MEASMLLILILQWMVALSLWKVVLCWHFVTKMDGSLVIMEASSLLRFVTLMDGSLVIMEGSSLIGFCYSNGW